MGEHIKRTKRLTPVSNAIAADKLDEAIRKWRRY